MFLVEFCKILQNSQFVEHIRVTVSLPHSFLRSICSHTRTRYWRCSIKKVKACNFIKKDTLAQVFSCEFWKKFLSTPFLQNIIGVLWNSNPEIFEISLRKICLNTCFLWPVFPRIIVLIRENTGPRKLVFWYILRTVFPWKTCYFYDNSRNECDKVAVFTLVCKILDLKILHSDYILILIDTEG